MDEKEPTGGKSTVTIQCQKVKPMSYHAYMRWSRFTRPHIDRHTRKFTHSIGVKVEDIGDKYSLSKVIKNSYGYGIFNVNFWSRYVKNKNFNHRFKCKGRCKYYSSCRIKGIRKKEFGACKLNPRFIHNWAKRATVEIKPDSKGTGFSYDFKFNLMHYMWFWYDFEDNG